MPVFKPYLTDRDYNSAIQNDQLMKQILTQATSRDKQFCENYATSLIRSFLSSRYDLNFEIAPTLPWSHLIEYKGNERVILDYAKWVTATAYALNDKVIHDGKAYICTTANSDAAWTIGNWELLGNQYDIYFIPLPYPLFSLDIKSGDGGYAEGYYNTGDKVWWNSRIYTALRASVTLSHSEQQQYPNYASMGHPNVFPNDVSSGASFWKDEGIYKMAAGVKPNQVQIAPLPNWELGDNRDPIIMQIIIDITLYKLNARIASQNIPAHRKQSYDEAMFWLNNVKEGEMTTDIKSKQPAQGNEIRWGSDIKKNNGIT